MKRIKPKFMIFKPAKSSMQSGLLNTKKWCLVTKDVENTFLSSKFAGQAVQILIKKFHYSLTTRIVL